MSKGDKILVGLVGEDLAIEVLAEKSGSVVAQREDRQWLTVEVINSGGKIVRTAKFKLASVEYVLEQPVRAS